MNKYYDGAHDAYKAILRKNHYCYKCNAKLRIFKHRKIIDQKSEEAKYYAFRRYVYMSGPCEFIHKAFYCPKCDEKIEFRTQIGFEDIDIILAKVKKYFAKKGRNIDVTKRYETIGGEHSDKIADISQIRNLRLLIEENGQHTMTYVLPISRSRVTEREYYFKLSKRKLIKSIEQ